MATKKKTKKAAPKTVTLKFTRDEAKRLYRFIDSTPTYRCMDSEFVQQEIDCASDSNRTVDWLLFYKLEDALTADEIRSIPPIS